jgi:predicted DNA binding protein
MPAGIRVTVEFPDSSGCPVASLSARAGAVINDVSTSVAAGESTACVSEFLVDADAVPEEYDAEPVIAYADQERYRVSHETDCPCACLGEFETPITRYFADAGTLRLVFHAPDFDTLQTVMGELRDRFPDVDVQRLVRAPTEGAPRDTVFVDRGKLTDRQLEVLRTAYELGYFDQPRTANATEVADELDITQSTFSEHLLAAQSKLFADVLEEGS